MNRRKHLEMEPTSVASVPCTLRDRTGYSHCESTAGYSLPEMIFVVAIVSVLLAFAVPNFVDLMPTRKTEVAEIHSFLETARARALARQQDVYVCFANELFHVEGFKFRACGMFEASDAVEESKPVDTRTLVLVEQWATLSPELIFAKSADLGHRTSGALRTVLDSEITREFSFRFLDGKDYIAILPYLLFNRTGRLEVPAFESRNVYVGLIEGSYDQIRKERKVTEKDELLAIDAMTGKISLVKDY